MFVLYVTLPLYCICVKGMEKETVYIQLHKGVDEVMHLSIDVNAIKVQAAE